MKINIKKTLFNLFLIGMAVLSLSACTLKSRQKAEATKDKAPAKTKIVVEKDMTAKDLADAGEQLVTPYTFMLADRTFSMALEKDGQQQKAQFYKALLSRFMVFKGILTRIKPLIEKRNLTKEYNRSLRNFPDSALKTFLLDGQPDIESAYSAQTFLNQYVRSVNSLREFLIKNPELKFDINLNPYLYQKTIDEEWGKSCNLIPSESSEMEIECNAQDVALRKVNAADLLVLRQISAGEILAFSLYASYSFQGYEELVDHDGFEQLPYSVQLSLAKGKSHFLTLRPDHVMNLWESIAQDFVAAVRLAERTQSELCPKVPNNSEEKLPGHLFPKGVCLADDAAAFDERDRALTMIEKALRGTFPIDGFTEEGEEFHTEIDPLIVSRRPILDLKALLPAKLPACGKHAVLPDHTLGGIFPRADADEHLQPGACEQ